MFHVEHRRLRAESTPRFRLIYAKQPDASVRISFEMAPPGGEDFSPYTTGAARRK
jgi:hypothetical protein